MRQLVTQRLANGLVVPVPVVRIRAQPELDHLAPVTVEAQRARLVRRVHGRVHLREQRDREAVRAHRSADPRVVAQALEEGEGAFRSGEVG